MGRPYYDNNKMDEYKKAYCEKFISLHMYFAVKKISSTLKQKELKQVKEEDLSQINSIAILQLQLLQIAALSAPERGSDFLQFKISRVARFCTRSSAERLAPEVGCQAGAANTILERTKDLYNMESTLLLAPLS